MIPYAVAFNHRTPGSVERSVGMTFANDHAARNWARNQSRLYNLAYVRLTRGGQFIGEFIAGQWAR